MSELRHPNESAEYRKAREALHKDEQDLIDKVKAVHVNTVWPYWNLFDFTPEGRPDRETPPQRFRSEFLEKNYLDAKSI